MDDADRPAALSLRPGSTLDEERHGRSSEEARLVLEAAIDLGDEATIEACRRVIDADRSGAPVPQSDLRLILGYFR